MTDIANLGFKVDTSGIDRANDSLDGLDKKGEKVSGKLSKSFKTMAKVGGAAALALGAAASKSIDHLDKIGKTADKVGLSTDALQELRHAADLTGISTQTLDTAMQRFARRSGEAAEGTGTLSKIFDELGISATNADGSIKGTEVLLNEFGNALGNVDSEAERLRLSMAAFDTEGAALGQLFKDGSEGAQVLRDSLQNVIPEKAIRDAELAKDAITNLGTATTNLGNAFLSQLSPYIAAAADWLANGLPDALRTAQDFVTDAIEATVNFGEAIKEMAADSVKFVVDMVSGIKDALIGTFTGIVDKAGELVGDVTGFFADMYDKVVGNSYVPDMIDRIGDEFGTLDTVMVEPSKAATEEVNEQFESMKDSVSDSLADAVISGGSFSDSIKGIFNGLLGNLKSFISSWASSGISKLFSSVFSGGFDTSGFGFGKIAAGAKAAYAGLSKAAGGAYAWATGAKTATVSAQALTPATNYVATASTQASSAMVGLGAAAGVVAVGMLAQSSQAKRSAEITAEVTAKMAEAEIQIQNTSLVFGQWGDQGVAQLSQSVEHTNVLKHAMIGLGVEMEASYSGALLIKDGFDEAKWASTAFTEDTRAGLAELVKEQMLVTDGQYDYALSASEAESKVGKAWAANLEMIDKNKDGINDLTGEMIDGVDAMQGAIDSLSGVDITSTHTLEQYIKSYKGDGGGGKALGTHGKFEEVPSGFPNDSYPVFLQSGEDYMVRTPADRAAASGGLSSSGDGEVKRILTQIKDAVTQNTEGRIKLTREQASRLQMMELSHA